MIIKSTAEEDWASLKAMRLASLLDTPTAFGVSHASAAAYTDSQWRDRAAGRGAARFVLAFEEDAAVGIAAHVVSERGECNLIAMWVAPPVRGTSAATELVEAVKAQAAALGHRRLVLGVASDNARAVAFYRRQGFTFLPEWEALESHPHIQVQKMACSLP